MSEEYEQTDETDEREQAEREAPVVRMRSSRLGDRKRVVRPGD